MHVHCTNDINNLNVQNENLLVHTSEDIENLNVQNGNFHVQSINDVDNLNVHNNYLHVHSEKYHHNFTCSEYKARDRNTTPSPHISSYA